MKYRRLIRDNVKRQLFKKTELFQRVVKILFLFHKNLNFMHLSRCSLFMKHCLNIFKTRIRNYCLISGRSRGVYRSVKISRIAFRELGSQGLFFGLKKASW